MLPSLGSAGRQHEVNSSFSRSSAVSILWKKVFRRRTNQARLNIRRSANTILFITNKEILFYRKAKRIQLATTSKILRLPRFPTSLHTKGSRPKISSTQSTTLTVACNRGIGVWSSNRSALCFWPPQHCGDRYQYQADRSLILLHLSFSQSIYTTTTDLQVLLKLLVILIQPADTDQR